MGQMSLSERVAIVTGGSRGIGLATAAALHEAGAAVMICGRSVEALTEAASGLVGGAPVATAQADLQQQDEAERVVRATLDKLGGLDILINNAGVGRFGPLSQLSLDDWQQTIGTNLSGVFYCCRAAVPIMRERGGGWIINVSSLAGKHPFAGGAAYCASKAGLNALTESLMQDVRRDGIRVSAVLPGSVNTRFGGHGPDPAADWKLAPEDVAQVIVDLLAHEPRSLPSRVELRPSSPPR
jgi:3-oxoacyl-[acyl-carrier protein] reductase